MEADGWHYSGDDDLMKGGFFWAENGLMADIVHVVRIEPLSADRDLPDNLLRVSVGEMFVPYEAHERRQACEHAGIDHRTATREQLVVATEGWTDSIKEDVVTMVQVGQFSPEWHRVAGIFSPDLVVSSEEELRDWLGAEHLPAPSTSPTP